MNEHQSHPGQFLARFDRVQTVCTGGISAAWSLVCTRSFVASAVFFPWYIWALAYYPELVLWWTAASAGILLVAVSSIWPRSFLYWLPPVLLWFNTAYHWLPWPYVKMAYVGPAALCLGVVIGAGRTGSRERVFSLDFILFFTCLLVAAGLGIASQFDFTREAAWHELGEQLRTVPLLDERMQYVPLRYAWAWCLGLALFAAVTRLLRGERDIRTLLWSFQWATLPATLFGIYSYHTRLYMVSYYVYERRINATFSSPAVLADLFTALFIAGFHLLRRAHSWPARICLVVLMAGQLLSIIYSGCRVNLLILCIVAAGWGVYRLVTLRRVRYLVYSAVFAAALAGVCAGGWTLMPPGVKARITASSAMTRAVRYASTVPAVQRVREWRRSLAAGASIRQTFLGGRWEHWSCAARMFKSSPLWGIGCGLFEQQYEHFRVSADVFQYARAHNVFLRVMAEGGMVTLAACAVFFVLAFWRLARSLSRSCAWESPVWAACTRGFLAVFAGIAISSMASDVLFENAETIMVFSVLAACAACSYRQLAATADMSSQLAVRLTGQVKRAVYFAELKLNWVELGVAPLWVFVKG
ncbi:O-antigen ligase family protein, partial [bacterium]|nr:O-antigen ligase family protein [bacterium]